MKKYAFLVLLSLLIAGFSLSCGKAGQTPGDVVKAFNKKVEKADASAKDLLAKDLAAMFEDEKLTAGLQDESNKIKEKGGISGITINEEIIEEETAKVNYTLTYGNGETEDETAHLVKEDGKWKITISK